MFRLCVLGLVIPLLVGGCWRRPTAVMGQTAYAQQDVVAVIVTLTRVSKEEYYSVAAALSDKLESITVLDENGEHEQVLHPGFDKALERGILIVGGNNLPNAVAHVEQVLRSHHHLKSPRFLAVATAQGTQDPIDVVGGCHIKVRFQPRSAVNLGGFETQSDDEGTVAFTAAGLPRARNGRCYVSDADGNDVEILVGDGMFFVRAVGTSYGKTSATAVQIPCGCPVGAAPLETAGDSRPADPEAPPSAPVTDDEVDAPSEPSEPEGSREDEHPQFRAREDGTIYRVQ